MNFHCCFFFNRTTFSELPFVVGIILWDEPKKLLPFTSTFTKQKVWEWYSKLESYMAHMWKWYGKVGWPYGIDMGPNFNKFQAMESIWEEKLMLSITWESYGDRMPIDIPYHWHNWLLHALYGTDMGCPHLKTPYVIHTSWHQFFDFHRISIWLLIWEFYGTKSYQWNRGP